jgi:hypothetical protein
MHVERDNPLLLAREFVRIGSQVLNVLHALNGRYCGRPSAFKRLDALEHELPVAPRDLAARLRSVFTLPAPEGAEALRSLVEETYDLVEVHLPEVDVDRLRALFRSDRQPLETPAHDRLIVGSARSGLLDQLAGSVGLVKAFVAFVPAGTCNAECLSGAAWGQ